MWGWGRLRRLELLLRCDEEGELLRLVKKLTTESQPVN